MVFLRQLCFLLEKAVPCFGNFMVVVFWILIVGVEMGGDEVLMLWWCLDLALLVCS
jgi:hypothetical protein